MMTTHDLIVGVCKALPDDWIDVWKAFGYSAEWHPHEWGPLEPHRERCAKFVLGLRAYLQESHQGDDLSRLLAKLEVPSEVLCWGCDEPLPAAVATAFVGGHRVHPGCGVEAAERLET